MSDLQDLIKRFVDGQDVPTLVGLMNVTPALKTALVLVDYSGMPEDRDVYTQFIRELWNENHWDDGMDVILMSPEHVRVTSRKVFNFIGAEDGHEHHLSAPTWFVDAMTDAVYSEEFFKAAKDLSRWILHLRTTDLSYLFLMDYPSGLVVFKQCIPKMEINISEGGN